MDSSVFDSSRIVVYFDLKLDSLNYATVEILEEAIGYPRDKLCLECWGV